MRRNSGKLDKAGLFECALSGRDSATRRHWDAPAAAELRNAVAGFEIVEMLGRGGMGAVYRASQSSLNRDVAIKILPPDLGSDAQFEERFRREAQTMARLHHPNIVHVYDFGQTLEGLFYVVMELIDGVDLQELITEKPMPPDEALRVISLVCDALEHAHQQGVVHRDIKPANVFLDASGHVKVGDFGLVRLFEGIESSGGGVNLTPTGSALGTADYVAPELMRGDAADCRSDIFSVGVMAYELLTGERPRGKFAKPSAKAAVGRAVDGLVLRAVEEKPENRHHSAAAMKRKVDKAGMKSQARLGWISVGAVSAAAGLVLLWALIPDNSEQEPLVFGELAEDALEPESFAPVKLADGWAKGGFGGPLSMGVIGNRTIGVAWIDNDLQLNYATPANPDYSDPQSWGRTKVANIGKVDRRISLFDLNGRPAIACFTTKLEIVLVVADSAAPQTWEDWKVSKVGVPAQHYREVSGIEFEGEPVILCSTAGDGDMLLARSIGETESWRIDKLAVGNPDQNRRCAIESIHGRLAILSNSFDPPLSVLYPDVDAKESLELPIPALLHSNYPELGSAFEFGDGIGVAFISVETETPILSWLDSPDSTQWKTVDIVPANEPEMRFFRSHGFLAGGRPVLQLNRLSRSKSETWLTFPDSKDPNDIWLSVQICDQSGFCAAMEFGNTIFFAVLAHGSGDLIIGSADTAALFESTRAEIDPFNPAS